MIIDLIQISPVKGILEGMKTSRHKDHIKDIPEKIFRWGHWSVLEHTSMTVKISEISRACTNQLVRQRIGVTFTQESQRYFDPVVDPIWYVIPPRIEKNEDLRREYIEARDMEAQEYRNYRENGIPKEDARFCLPNACKTIVTWTFNMNSLIWFLEQRLKKDAQWEIRMLAKKLYDLVMTTEWKQYLLLWKPESRR